jgi:hypothetical protein
MNKEAVLAKLNEFKNGEKNVAIIVNVDQITNDGVSIIGGISGLTEPGKNSFFLKSKYIKNFIVDFQNKPLSNDFEQRILIMKKNGTPGRGGQIPAITQRPCPVTWARFEIDNENLTFDII